MKTSRGTFTVLETRLPYGKFNLPMHYGCITAICDAAYGIPEGDEEGGEPARSERDRISLESASGCLVLARRLGHKRCQRD